MQDRRPLLVVRLSESDAQTVRPAAEASGLALDAFLVAATLRFLAADPDFRRQFNTAGQVSWGAPPRFAAAELVEIQLSEAQGSAIDRAAGIVRFQRSGESVEVTPAQFMVGAALRMIQRQGRGKLAALKNDLGPFLGPEVPKASVLERAEVAPHRPNPEPLMEQGFSSTVIVSASVMRLPSVQPPAPRPAQAQRSKTLKSPKLGIDAQGPIPVASKRRDQGPTATHPLVAQGRQADALLGEDDDDAVDLSAAASGSGRGSNTTLKLGLGIGAVTLLAVVLTAAVAVPRSKAPTAPTSEPAPEAAPEAAPEPITDEPARLPGSLVHRKGPEPAEPEPSRPTLPPPPDLPPSTPDNAAAVKALKALTAQFHNKGTPSADIDALLHTVYGRPRVGADGRIVQSDKLTPEHRYDLFIQRAVEDVARVYPVPVALVKAIIKRESNFNADAKSGVGAVGLMQVMPFNAAKLNLTITDLSDPEKNILAGTRLIAVLLKYYDGDITNALVAYNAKARPLFAPIPQNGETPGYVAAVLENLKKFSDSAALEPPH